MSYEVIHGNALALPLEDATVDLIITSPPYFALRSYRDGDEHYEGQIGSEPTPQDFLEALWAATREMVRVLKPSGSIWVNLGDKYAGTGGGNGQSGLLGKKEWVGAGADNRAHPRNNTKQTTGFVPAKSLMGLPWRYAIGCVDQLGLILRAEIIWSKPNGLPESVTDRVRRSHEQWFHMVKSPRYFAAVDEVREAYEVPNHNAVGTRSRSARRIDAVESRGGYDGIRTENPLGKLPGSVWTIPSEPLIIPDAVKQAKNLPDHFAAFPQEWPRRIILGWSPSGICTACGEGRRPVVEKEATGVTTTAMRLGQRHKATGQLGPGDHAYERGEWAPGVLTTITGYACACPEPTAPTTPAVILDPFGGTGTVAGIAHALGRHGISVDLSQDYCRLAEWRISQSGHFQKAWERSATEGAAVPATSPQDTLEGRLSLFDEAS